MHFHCKMMARKMGVIKMTSSYFILISKMLHVLTKFDQYCKVVGFLADIANDANIWQWVAFVTPTI